MAQSTSQWHGRGQRWNFIVIALHCQIKNHWRVWTFKHQIKGFIFSFSWCTVKTINLYFMYLVGFIVSRFFIICTQNCFFNYCISSLYKLTWVEGSFELFWSNINVVHCPLSIVVVVAVVVNFTHFHLLLHNHWANFNQTGTTEVAQWVTGFALQVEGWVFESQPRQT